MYRVVTPVNDNRMKICLHIFDTDSANLEAVYTV